jgi:hypothetical protein
MEADLKVARNAVDLLGDALDSIPTGEPGPERYDGVGQAAEPPALAESDHPADPLCGPPREVPPESFAKEDMFPMLVTIRTIPPPAVQQPVIPTTATDLLSSGAGSPTSAEARDGFPTLAAGAGASPRMEVSRDAGADGFNALAMVRIPTACDVAVAGGGRK